MERSSHAVFRGSGTGVVVGDSGGGEFWGFCVGEVDVQEARSRLILRREA
jgi:hypothetical protein